jgi:ABC-type Fe3+-siderophore transport system permease subunit
VNLFTQSKRLIVLTSLLVFVAAVTLLRGLDAPFAGGIDSQILWQLRLPVVITAIVVGSALAVSSASLQVLLRNPLADPGIIGITSGASLFAAVFLLLGGSLALEYGQYLLPLFCFFGALLSSLCIYFIAKRMPGVTSAVILAGIAISTLCGAIVAWMYLFTDAQSMRNLTFWLMGSLHQADWHILSIAAPVIIFFIGYLLCQGQNLNWYYFGASDAQLAGLDVSNFNFRVLLSCALVVGIAVSIAGSIAFVGLLVPHILRSLFGFDNRFILPGSALLGATLLLLVVVVSDTIMSVNIPVSMLTATLGGPVFLWSIVRLSKPRL